MSRWTRRFHRLTLAAALLLGLPFVRPLAAKAHEERQILRLSSGRTIEARVRFPEKMHTTPLPAVLVFGGFQNAARVLDEVAGLGLSDSMVLVGFDYPFTHPRRFEFPKSLLWYSEATRMLHDTIEGVVLLAERLSQDERIQPGIIALGASLGAPLVLAAAARSPQISQLILVHGFGDIPKTLSWQFEQSWQKRWKHGAWLAPLVARPLAHLAWSLSGLRPPEESALELRASQQVLWIEAERDTFIPQSGRKGLREALLRSNASVAGMVTRGDHVQPGSRQLMRQIGSATRSWLLLERSRSNAF